MLIKAFGSEIPSYNVVTVDHELMKAHMSYLSTLASSRNQSELIPFPEFWDERNRMKAYDDYLAEIRVGGVFCNFFDYWSDWVQLRLLRNDPSLFLVGGLIS